ncbi:uncharacterized protein EDB91DRAFT_1087394 [Suillus paluster]|uniref:uncharacterized protein n=1 Tax=Suillus paluster TaxID=48578 RepID=UPI001B865007|nr:uncharacterized protein EDB91DRAFT_1087394 [Suillus paluster]KAG1724632.1 hypothetical protein EDB91DRAFT_1087394 [Suillus paluster]
MHPQNNFYAVIDELKVKVIGDDEAQEFKLIEYEPGSGEFARLNDWTLVQIQATGITLALKVYTLSRYGDDHILDPLAIAICRKKSCNIRVVDFQPHRTRPNEVVVHIVEPSLSIVREVVVCGEVIAATT